MSKGYSRWYKAHGAGYIGDRAGWYLIGGRTYYYKSRFEVMVACHWNHMAQLGVIHSWWYEPYIFKFDKTRGITSYCPDFEIRYDGAGRSRNMMIEAKGYLSDLDCRKIRQFHKDYPSLRLLLMVQNLKRLQKSLWKSVSKGNKTSLKVLETLEEWGRNERGKSSISICDWDTLRKTNQYGLGLLESAMKVDPPIGGPGYRKRQNITIRKAARLPHEDPQAYPVEPPIDEPGAK